MPHSSDLDDVFSVLPRMREAAFRYRLSERAADDLIERTLRTAIAEQHLRPSNASYADWLHSIMIRYLS
jgi:DNA-directed RNA polymerase specialized sigma24 family protein